MVYELQRRAHQPRAAVALGFGQTVDDPPRPAPACSLVALPGFYIGYLPYTLFQEQIDAVVVDEGLTDFITILEWTAYTIGGSDVQWALLYSLTMIGLLVMSFQAARVFLRVKLSETLSKNTDELVYGMRPAPAGA